ncbi:MAG TPA: class III extradiol ring-cleavage dioxygenase [Paracoccaceae bacterium]|nr:class III extradiol ring-cleavage dioxygenase [Paracoccaceae bacterium]
MRQPVLFISHGSPGLILEDTPARAFLAGLGAELGRPRAVLAISAHWEADRPLVSEAERPETIHDFRGFPEALYRMQHPCPGAPEVAEEVGALLAEAGYRPALAARGLDHGAWVPMKLIDPEAKIPVLQLSLLAGAGATEHWRLGQAVAPMRDRDVLILASGSMTHNLGEIFRGGLVPGRPVEPWATAFADWVAARIEANEVEALVDYRARAPEARRNHPTEEHLVPLHVALGAACGEPGRRIHASVEFGALAMDAYRFG